MKVLTRFIRETDGLEIVEWALLGAVFALAAALGWGGLGEALEALLGDLDLCQSGDTC